MKRSITVQSQAEGDALVRSMEDPIMRAVIVVGGALADLSPAARRAVLGFASATLDTPQDATPIPTIEAGRMRLHDAAAVGRSTGE
jgi:hypothetical protein